MTAEEIRKIHVYGSEAGTAEIAEFLREIAAQLAELNARMEPGNLIANIHVVEMPKLTHDTI